MTLDRVGRWSIQKLDMLTEYASAYSVVMNAQKRSWLEAYYYIDAFAGPGIALNKGDPEVEAYLQGSPLRVLNIEPKFDYLWFIDRNPKRAGLLAKTMLDQGADQARFSIESGTDANSFIKEKGTSLGSRERALVFLDPYGLQVAWETVTALAETRKADVLINFSLMGVTRNLRRVGGPSGAFRALLDRTMRSTAWVDELYTLQGDLFGEPVAVRGDLAASVLAERYQADLRTIFESVSDPAIMTNSKGGPIYALIFASQNKGAAPGIMRDVVSKAR